MTLTITVLHISFPAEMQDHTIERKRRTKLVFVVSVVIVVMEVFVVIAVTVVCVVLLVIVVSEVFAVIVRDCSVGW